MLDGSCSMAHGLTLVAHGWGWSQSRFPDGLAFSLSLLLSLSLSPPQTIAHSHPRDGGENILEVFEARRKRPKTSENVRKRPKTSNFEGRTSNFEGRSSN